MDNLQGNVSTIASMVWAIIISPILISYGIQVDNVMGTAIVSGFILLCILIWSAVNPNSLGIFGNKKPQLDTAEPVLNDEYITGDVDDS